ncbi:Lipase/lipooxygenase, PLAT/LH2 [Cynara cardunculus var. scolymus]|uniref:Lipoxygenase n=1 Tax=Cynara cardunculus var. scolymus TaxID=59895 RepID=A0A103Y3B4_CYNCS|nr:Lipase/lipooxygenase, PLAT/LH2 [Cynara cardunculus var. scolymus]
MGNQPTTRIAEDRKKTIKGRVVLEKKNFLVFEVTDLGASFLDRVHELLGKNISFQLISADHHESSGTSFVHLGFLRYHWFTKIAPLKIKELTYEVSFDWNEEMGIPGAFMVKNNHHSEFYLKTLTLEDVPGHGQLHFVCNSWVYPSKQLVILRGTGSGMLQKWDRVYDYAFYNDLGNPDDNVESARPVLGGSSEYPYPRRGRTGRPPTKSDPKTESRLPTFFKGLEIYVPKDEQFGALKLSGFLGYGLKSAVQFSVSKFWAQFDGTRDEFDSFEDVLKIYDGGLKLPDGVREKYRNILPLEMLKALAPSDDISNGIGSDDKSAWRSDEEFAREMLAGVNPVCIRLLEEFPPTSNLDLELYGNQNSSIKPSHIEQNLNGLQIKEAIKSNRLFILDHHDSLMPYVRRINATPTKIYATRTLLFLQKDGTLKPLAIELSLPHPDGDQLGAISKVYTPAKHGAEESVWHLAKAYVAVNDSGVHQLISHWLNTHAVIEPFVIATNRQLSVLHPIHKLLKPHFRDTMSVNAFGRQVLLNDGGLVEKTVFPGRYAMEMSSFIYKNWVLTDHALPVDLVKRGMAIEDSNSPHGLRLLIEDYPYAVDGLEIWFAIKTWVEDYCTFYYKNDEMVLKDLELESWWKELIEQGHGDKKHEPWWPTLDSCHNLIDTCTTIIWVASALHAAVNFGQYSYAGYFPNRPTISRRLMPEPHTKEYDEVEENLDNVLLKTMTAQHPALMGISLIELLSRHPSDEVYLGHREPNWTMDLEPLKAFEKFGKELKDIEERIEKRNGDKSRRNRVGVVDVRYTLLQPYSQEGLTGKGIPNSVSI